MEGLRTFLKVIICIILVPIILGFSIILQTKDIVENQFIVEAVKQGIANEIENSDIDQSKVDELTNTKGANELIQTVFAEYRKYAEDNTYKVGDETAEMIINFCLENEKTLEEISEEDLDFDELKKPEAKEEIKKSLDEAFRDINEEGNEDIAMLVYGYAQLTSQESLIKEACVIAVLIALIILLSWSTYKWMTAVGVVGLVTGTITIGLYVAVSALATLIKENVGIDVNANLLMIIGGIEFVLGLAFVITRSVLDSNAKKAKLENNEDVINEPEVKDEPVVNAETEVAVKLEENETKETDEN